LGHEDYFAEPAFDLARRQVPRSEPRTQVSTVVETGFMGSPEGETPEKREDNLLVARNWYHDVFLQMGPEA
jgi:hypothetical protein